MARWSGIIRGDNEEDGFQGEVDKFCNGLCENSIIFCFGKWRTLWDNFSYKGDQVGDPLSPFLFLLCTEGLNGLTKKAELQGDIHGYFLCRRGQKLMHLVFANDGLIFCRAIMDEYDNVLDIPKEYEEASR